MSDNKRDENVVHNIATQCISVRMRLLNRMVNTLYDKALQPYNIKVSQLNILVAVAFSGKSTSKELCDLLQMDKSTFSRTLTRLGNSGWLSSQPSGEGKIMTVAITKEGLRKIHDVYPAWQQAQAEVSNILGAQAAAAILEQGTLYLKS